jgi:dienelactone hydrolase
MMSRIRILIALLLIVSNNPMLGASAPKVADESNTTVFGEFLPDLDSLLVHHNDKTPLMKKALCPFALDADGTKLAFFDHQSGMLNFRELATTQGQPTPLQAISIGTPDGYALSAITWAYNPDFLILQVIKPAGGSKALTEYTDSRLDLLQISTGMRTPFVSSESFVEVQRLSKKHPNKVLISFEHNRQSNEKKDVSAPQTQDKPEEVKPAEGVAAEQVDEQNPLNQLKRSYEQLIVNYKQSLVDQARCHSEIVDAYKKALDQINGKTHNETVVALYDLTSGELKEIDRFKCSIDQFACDDDFNLKAAWSEVKHTNHCEVVVLAPSEFSKGEWTEVFSAGHSARVDRGDLSVCCLSRDYNNLYLLDGRMSNFRKLYGLDLKTGDRSLVREFENADIRSVIPNIFDDEGSGPDLLGIAAGKDTPDLTNWHDLDPRLEKLLRCILAVIEKSEEQHLCSIIAGITGASFSLNRNRFLIQDLPNTFSLFDMEQGTLLETYSLLPRLERFVTKFNPIERGVIKSPDGFDIHYFLTKPGKSLTPLPCVVEVHGGPWARAKYQYDLRDQSLAGHLGVATLKVNFRGSTGHGKKFKVAGDGEWAGKILDDILLVTNALIEKGSIDPDRLIISGGSFGGYATMAMLAFRPGIFKAGYSVNGDSDLVEAITSENHLDEKRYWQKRMGGDPEVPAEKRALLSRSPAHCAGRINVPLLCVAGEEDTIVYPKQSAIMIAALKAIGKPASHVIFKGEGHGFGKTINSLAELALYHGFVAQTFGLPVHARVSQVIAQSEDLQVVEGGELLSFLPKKPAVATQPKAAQVVEVKEPQAALTKHPDVNEDDLWDL